MPDIYAYPTANETAQGITGLFVYMNNVTGGVFFPLILLAMFIIIMAATSAFGVIRAFVFATFFCSVLSMFMVVFDVLNPIYMYLLFVMLAGGLMALRLLKSSSLPQI